MISLEVVALKNIEPRSALPPHYETYPAPLTRTLSRSLLFLFFFFNDTATTEIYTLSLHDALPISMTWVDFHATDDSDHFSRGHRRRSEEHTSELQSHDNLVCRLLLEKKKKRR